MHLEETELTKQRYIIDAQAGKAKAAALIAARRESRRYQVGAKGQPMRELGRPQRLGAWIVARDFVMLGGNAFQSLVVIDQYTHAFLRYWVSAELPVEQLIVNLESLIHETALPAELRIERGRELCSERFLNWCAARGIAVQMGPGDRMSLHGSWSPSGSSSVKDASRRIAQRIGNGSRQEVRSGASKDHMKRARHG
jgi:hypothetical protein